MKPLYIFDLDGTLALTEHRQHILNGSEPDKWRRFFAACVHDEPNSSVVNTLRMLRHSADIYIWSGRSDEVREQSEFWLSEYIGDFGCTLKMREAGDFTPDEILKKQWFDELDIDDRIRLVAVFDDRDKVVNMWRESGVACFQVAQGNF